MHVDREIGTLVRREYRPCFDLCSQLTAYLAAALEAGQASRSILRIRDLGTIQVSGARRLDATCSAVDIAEERLSSWPSTSAETRGAAAAERPGTAGDAHSTPLVYGDEKLGDLSWSPLAEEGAPEESAQFHARLGHRLALQIHRFRLRAATQRVFERDLSLIGASEALHVVEEQLERAAGVDLPVLIEGEFGTEKLQAACAVHFGGGRRQGPFVEVCCAAQAPDAWSDPALWFERARGGSLFLNGIEDLHADLLTRLPTLMRSRVNQWLDPAAASQDVRLIASTARDLRELVDQGRFPRLVYAELGFLPIRLAGVRERQGDIAHLTHQILHKYGGTCSEALSDDALEAIEAYDWPDNVFEMERVLGRLSAMRTGRTILFRDLAAFAPRVARSVESDAGTRQRSEAPVGRRCRERPAEPAADADAGVEPEELARRILAGELGELEQAHEGVRRALEYIGHNYQEEISLGDLAGAAYVSPSHLCYLFKNTLGLTFKTVLGICRVERAKELLVLQPGSRITDISLDVGFGDLSHFERTFKRIVKCSPRDYRRERIAARRAACKSEAREDPPWSARGVSD